MMELGRWLVRVGLLLVVGVIDKVFGLPLLLIYLSFILGLRWELAWRLGLFLMTSLMITTWFAWPWWLSWLMVWGGYGWLVAGESFLGSHHFRLLLWGVFIWTITGWWLIFNWTMTLYFILTSIVMFFFLKKRRLFKI